MWRRGRHARKERSLLLKAALFCLAALVITQALMLRPEIRERLSIVDRMEGTSLRDDMRN